MTVRDLIEALSKFDGDLPVYLPYSEGGVDDVGEVTAINVERDYRARVGFNYFGDHNDADLEDPESGPRTPGVRISS